jgi:anti-repressor protein
MSRNEIKVFDNAEFGEVRTTMYNSEPVFCLADVCRVLDIANSGNVKNRLSEKGICTMDTLTSGGMQKMIFITESNLYKVIFQSRKPEAEKFSDWVTSEVLPSIRKHGMYAVDDLIANPELAIKAFTALKEEREKNKALQADNERMKPKEEFFDAVTDSKDAIDMGQVAKVLNYPKIGRNKLFEILRDNGILQQNNQPYQTYIDRGYFRVVEQKFEPTPGEIRINIKTLVFQKGIDYIRKILDARVA